MSIFNAGKYKLWFILFIISLTPALAQEIKNPVWVAQDTSHAPFTVAVNWKKGELKKLRAKKKTFKYEKDSLKSEKVEYDAIVQIGVKDSLEESYLMEFRMLENLRDTSKDMDLSEAFLNITEDDLVLEYSVSKNGAFLKYENRPKVEAKLGQMMDAILKKTKAELKSDAERKVFDEVASKLASGPVLFDKIYNAFVAQYHFINGYATGLNDTLRYDEEVPNPFGITPITFDCLLYITSVDTTTNEIQYDVEKYSSLKEYMKEYAQYQKQLREKSGLKADPTLGETLASLESSMEVYTTNYINAGTGWVTFMKLDRYVNTKESSGNQASNRELWVMSDNLNE